MSDDLVKRLRRRWDWSNDEATTDGMIDERAEAADRIEALESALLAADELAQSAHSTIHDDADTSLVDALAAYRKARGGET